MADTCYRAYSQFVLSTYQFSSLKLPFFPSQVGVSGLGSHHFSKEASFLPKLLINTHLHLHHGQGLPRSDTLAKPGSLSTGRISCTFKTPYNLQSCKAGTEGIKTLFMLYPATLKTGPNQPPLMPNPGERSNS